MDRSKRREHWAGYAFVLLHLLTLWAFAVAQPIYDLLGRYPEFLVARRMDFVELTLLVAVLSIVIPLAAGCLLLVLFLVKGPWGRTAQGAAFGVLMALGWMPVLKKLSVPGDAWTVLLAGVLAVVGVVLYFRLWVVRSFFSFLSPAILVFPAALALFSPAARMFQTAPSTPSDSGQVQESDLPPVVMLIFDELPLATLLDSQGMIDGKRFPNFASLAADAIWYQDATAVGESTHKSVPAALTGVYPDEQKLPTFHDYPESLFSLLEPTHEMRVFESITQLCPSGLCPETFREPLRNRVRLLFDDLAVIYGHLVLPSSLTSRLPDVGNDWQNFRQGEWQLERSHFFYREAVTGFDRFLETLNSDPIPRLYFYHAAFPHFPWMYLPSGKRYAFESRHELFFENGIWTETESLVRHAFQRYLLQMGFTDRLLGRLIQRLKEVGLYDRAVIAVLADHGMTFRPNGFRRKATPDNFSEIIAVPLLMRFPEGERGAARAANVELVDLLPTIADYLDIPLAWDVDGFSLLSGKAAPRDRKLMFTQAPGPPFEVDLGLHDVIDLGACVGGQTYRLSPGELVGRFEFKEGPGRVEFWGEAGNERTEKPADGILVFLNGRLIRRLPLNEGRPEVAEFYDNQDLYYTGFRVDLDASLIEREAGAELRFFAVQGSEIGELQYPSDLPWQQPEEPDAERYPQGCDAASGEGYLTYYTTSGETSRPEGQEFAESLIVEGQRAGPELLLPPAASPELLGVGVGELEVEAGDFVVKISNPGLYGAVDPAGGFVPAEVEGLGISDRPLPDGAHVAIALNGVISAVVPLFEADGEENRFLAVLPEGSFISGSNQLDVYMVWESEGTSRIAILAVK